MGSERAERNVSQLGNGVVGILAETVNMWERRAPLTPSHCARLVLRGGRSTSGVNRIIVQPSTKRIHHDAQYEDAGCEISDDLSECGLIIGIKQPTLEMILPDRAYAFFSHTHKAQKENMPLLDKILQERVSLFDYELIVDDDGKRLIAFGKFAGRAGLIDFLHGLGRRYLSLGYSTPFLSLGQSHMYPSLAAAKAAVIAVGEEIATFGLPSGILPIIFVFTGSGNGYKVQTPVPLAYQSAQLPLRLTGTLDCHESVGADETATLDKIIDSLTSIANAHRGDPNATEISLKIGRVSERRIDDSMDKVGPKVLILGAGRVCRPAAEFLSSYRNIDINGCNDYNTDQVHVIVASLYQKDAEETIDGIKNATAAQLDVSDIGSLSNLVSQVEVVVSLLPASFHAAIARVCIELKKHLVTASYVDDSMSKLEQAAQGAGVTILCEMGLDPGIDHMLSMKMIDEAHAQKGEIKAFTSFCGGLPSPAAANNPLAYKFSWSPAGAIRAGRNPAVYKFLGEIIHVDGNKLYESAKRIRLPELPAFALEHLPNRNSLMYGDLYGISKEASTVYRSTLRYEGFSEIMAILAKIGFFDATNHPLLEETNRPTYRTFLSELLNVNDISPPNTKDMVLLHHEVEVEYPDGRPAEKHQATLLEFGKSENGRSTTAMALTVGVPAAIGALLLLQNKVQRKGVIRPLEPEIYIPDVAPSQINSMAGLEEMITTTGEPAWTSSSPPLWFMALIAIGLHAVAGSAAAFIAWLYRAFLRPGKDLVRRYGAWAVVTGATDGIGRAMALELARRGLNLVLIGRNPAKLSRVGEEVQKAAPSCKVTSVVFDLAGDTPDMSRGVARVVAAVEGLDVGILVNNAGATYPGAAFFHEVETKVWEAVVRVNVEAATRITRAIVPAMMKRRRGAVVNMGSGSSAVLPAFPFYAVYAASKA
ncbi:hypothetical protein ACQ4PT_037255 [Festuca glaucescens]